MEKMKYFLAVAAMSPLALLAEGGSNAIDTSAASGALSDLVDAFKTYITAATPYLVALLGACLGISLLWIAWKWFRKGSAKA